MTFPFSPQAGRRWRNAPDEGQAARCVRALPTLRIKPYEKGAPHPTFGHPRPALAHGGERDEITDDRLPIRLAHALNVCLI